MQADGYKYIRDLNLSSLGFTLIKELTSEVICSLLAEESMRNLRCISVGECVLLDDLFSRSVTMYCPYLFDCKRITERALERTVYFKDV